MPEQILLSKRQAAQVLSISIRTLDKLILTDRLPVRRIGRRVLVRILSAIGIFRQLDGETASQSWIGVSAGQV
jgi:hypothetical protein